MSKIIGHPFTRLYDGLSRTLNAEVGIAPVNGRKPDVLDLISLWDTGATNSVITDKIVKTLGLMPVSFVSARTPSGEYVAPIFYVGLYLPNGVLFPKLRVMGGSPANCDVLIGMDVIGTGDFAVSNVGGKTAFTFRVPSLVKFDFAKHSYLQPIENRESPDAPAKNSKCPCGSGLKYKQCCGKKRR